MKKLAVFLLTLAVAGSLAAQTVVVPWRNLGKTGSDLADLETRSASDLSSGTLPDARFPATLPAISGANLTNLDASDLASGTVPDARFPATLPALSGANLTALNATQITSGTLPSARLPTSGVSANTYGSATAAPVLTIDATGRVTTASTATVTPAWASITGKPTTLSGFGIVDSLTAESIALRDATSNRRALIHFQRGRGFAPLGAQGAIGTSDFSILLPFQFESSYSDLRGIGGISDSSGSVSPFAGSAVRFGARIEAGGVLIVQVSEDGLFRQRSTTLPSSALGRFGWLVLGRADGAPFAWVNGTELNLGSESHNGGPDWGDAINASNLVLGLFGSSEYLRGVVGAPTLLNRAWTQADADRLMRDGALTVFEKYSGNFLARNVDGDMEAVGTAAYNSFGGVALSKVVDPDDAGNQVLQAAAASSQYQGFTTLVTAPRAGRYLFSFRMRAAATGGTWTAPTVAFNSNGDLSTSTGVGFGTTIPTPTAVWTTVTGTMDVFDPSALVYFRVRIFASAEGAPELLFDDVTLTEVGAVAAFDIGPDYQAVGRFNGIDLNLANGAEPIPLNATRGTFRGSRTSDGFLGLGGRILGRKRILTDLWLYSASGGTMTLGDASGSPANVVASVSLTAGLWTRATLLKSQLSGGLLYADLGTATDVQVIGETRDGSTLN